MASTPRRPIPRSPALARSTIALPRSPSTLIHTRRRSMVRKQCIRRGRAGGEGGYPVIAYDIPMTHSINRHKSWNPTAPRRGDMTRLSPVHTVVHEDDASLFHGADTSRQSMSLRHSLRQVGFFHGGTGRGFLGHTLLSVHYLYSRRVGFVLLFSNPDSNDSPLVHVEV